MVLTADQERWFNEHSPSPIPTDREFRVTPVVKLGTSTGEQSMLTSKPRFSGLRTGDVIHLRGTGRFTRGIANPVMRFRIYLGGVMLSESNSGGTAFNTAGGPLIAILDIVVASSGSARVFGSIDVCTGTGGSFRYAQKADTPVSMTLSPSAEVDVTWE